MSRVKVRTRSKVRNGLLVGGKFVPNTTVNDSYAHLEEISAESYAGQVDARIEVLNLVKKIGGI